MTFPAQIIAHPIERTRRFRTAIHSYSPDSSLVFRLMAAFAWETGHGWRNAIALIDAGAECPQSIAPRRLTFACE